MYSIIFLDGRFGEASARIVVCCGKNVKVKNERCVLRETAFAAAVYIHGMYVFRT